MKKLIIPVLVLGIIGYAIFYRINDLKGQESLNLEGIEAIQQREGFPVNVTKVNRGSFTVWRTIQGKVEGYRQAFIATPDAARVAVIKYKVGDRVKADTPIISLDENDPKNISNVKLLRSVYEDAAKDYEQYTTLYESGGISKDVLDKVHLQMKTVKTNLDSAQATVHLTCPFNGVLLALYIREGENAEPNKTLAVVSSLNTVRIVTAVSDRDVGEFKRGQKVLVRYNSSEPLEGTVDRVALGANPDSGLFDIELKVRNRNRALKVGMFISAEILVVNVEDGLYVDYRAILRDFDAQDYVWIVKDKAAYKSNVTILNRNDTYSLIEGVAEDTSVVLSGKSLLRDGSLLLILNGEAH